MSKIKIAELITTFAYIGRVKYCPGTFGALAAYFVAGALVYLASSIVFQFITPTDASIATFFIYGVPIMLSAVILLLFFVGIYFSSIYIKYTGRQDPKEIVIDEVVGQLLTIVLCLPCTILLFSIYNDVNIIKNIFIIWYLPSFILFRLFDIFKPWPINWIDQNIKGGLGVMLDDVVAAVFASVANYVIVYLFIGY